MATTAKVAKNERRKKLVAQYREQRATLKKAWLDPSLSDEERDAAYSKLKKLPRDSSPTRVRNRCVLSGRPRGYYRKFGLSRIALRDLALRGDLPGVIKASW
ncbi:MAG: 30S ribosomal protein S14 [Acidobacteriota bacterium]